MNERIKELLLKAGFTNAYTDPKEGFELVFVDEEHTTESVAKFAELLIRECEKVAKDGPWYYDAPSCGWRNPINFVCKEMKEHFGVKE